MLTMWKLTIPELWYVETDKSSTFSIYKLANHRFWACKNRQTIDVGHVETLWHVKNDKPYHTLRARLSFCYRIRQKKQQMT